MTIVLELAAIADAQEIYDLQIKSFKALLEKYQDYDYSPGAEKLERTIQRLNEPTTDYYFISLDGKHIGGLRICHFDKLCKLKQLYILPEYQGFGYAQKAITIAESLYPAAEKWELDTILQEEKLCYLYEKMGYKKTGKVEPIMNGMDIVYYAKQIISSQQK
ncbi:MAG: GNAT family N-acetyltransferase [Clostridiaceae bacterium]|nr:GNAT family N-acetyltransferase [Clostridiaceae bacterium]